MASFNYVPSGISINQRIALPILSNNISIARHAPLRNMATLNSTASLNISSRGAASALLGSPVALTMFQVSGNNIAILSDLGELPRVLNSIESMKNGVAILCSCAVEGDAAGMSRAANEGVLPHMRSANIIDRKFLESNSLAVDIAAVFLQELRQAQLELMTGTRRQIEKIAEMPAEELTEKEMQALAGAVQIASETAEQAAITDLNEGTITDELWHRMWAKSPAEALSRYHSTKIAIMSQQEKLSALLETIYLNIEFLPSSSIPDYKSTMSESDLRGPKGLCELDAPAVFDRAPIEIKSGYSFLASLLDLLEKQSEARRKASEKMAEEKAEEKRAGEKRAQSKRQQIKRQAKIAEAKKLQAEYYEGMDSIRAYISEALAKLELSLDLSPAADRTRAADTVLYYEHLVSTARSLASVVRAA